MCVDENERRGCCDDQKEPDSILVEVVMNKNDRYAVTDPLGLEGAFIEFPDDPDSLIKHIKKYRDLLAKRNRSTKEKKSPKFIFLHNPSRDT